MLTKHTAFLFRHLQHFRRRKFSNYLDISKEVQKAFNEKRPIVALESTIITHGMPYPSNMETALEVEEIVRKNDAVPATIAIINGRIKVGLSKENLTELASRKEEVIKCSRRDLPYVIAYNKTGGTTVCGTMIIANKVGLKIFATGGIGGVHREGQNSLDISADLVELGRTPVTVVCSGVKSILDIPRTLEFLETQGVCVATYGEANGNFPDFYTRDSGCKVPYNLAGPIEAAKLIETLHEMDLQSGILIANPIPHKYALNKNEIQAAIDAAYIEAERQGVTGKEVTPFLLAAIVKITKGNSLEANIALIKNNADVAAQIANALCSKTNFKPRISEKEPLQAKHAPFIVGASILDLSLTIASEFPQNLDGATFAVQTNQNPGGVARNLAEGIYKLYGDVNFLSAVGDDELGRSLLNVMPTAMRKNVQVIQNESTSLCSVIFDKMGDCKLILGNMDIHQRITTDLIMKNETILSKTPLVVFDGNLTIKAMECLLHLAARHKRPVFFEPTDLLIADKPFNLPPHLIQTIKIISPNFYELQRIAETISGMPSNLKLKINADTALILKEAKHLLKSIEKHFDCIVLTLGHHGVIISVSSDYEKQPLFDSESGKYLIENNKTPHSMTFYKALPVKNIKNVSGAGDSFSSGFIAGLLRGLTTKQCVGLGFRAAERALQTQSAVPKTYFTEPHDDLEAFMTVQNELQTLKI